MKTITQLKNKLVNAFTSNNDSNSTQPNVAQSLSNFDILAKNSMSSSIYDKCVVNFEDSNDVEALRTCKVLKFSPNLSFEDVLSKIKKLNSQQCPNLFIFAIELEDLLKTKLIDLQNCLHEFSSTRPIILQLKTQKDNSTKLYFRIDGSNLIEIPQINTTDQSFVDFSTFLQQFLSSKITNFEGLMLDKLPTIKDSSHIIRFLKALKMSKGFYQQLVLKYSTNGTKDDLLAAIDAPLEGDGRMLNCGAENWIKNTMAVRQRANSQENKENQVQSILLAAITSKNEKVLNYLTSHCGHLIQQLPFDHQVQVSTAAFIGQHFDVLSDLVKLCDFPFPENFKPESIENERFNQIVEERKKFIEAVELDELNLDELSKFIGNNQHLSIVYTFDNESTLYHALINEHYKAYFHLKSLGFQAKEFDEIDEVLDEDDLKEAVKYEKLQRKENVENSTYDYKNPVYLLTTRSSIHNRKIRSEDEVKCRQSIKKWYEDIYNSRFGSLLLQVASMCPKLKIIFDFESDSVENVSLQSKYTQGSMYPGSKWIFVGAKLTGTNREQQIKGVLAHELCHYVMKLTYENNEEPFFKHDKNRRQIFTEIVKALDKWSVTKTKEPDDECDEIISGVYRCYSKKDLIAELIVRIPQIMAQFDNNLEKIRELEVLYERLFQYYESFVVPDMQTLDLDKRENIRKLNKNFKIFPKISKLNFEFPSSKNIDRIYAKTDVAMSNVPMFLYSELNKSIGEMYGNLSDVCNIFVDYVKIKNNEIWSNFLEIITRSSGLNIFIDCIGSNDIELAKVGFNEANNFIFICSKQEQFNQLTFSIQEANVNPNLTSKDYDWHDLSQNSQKSLLQSEIEFQNSKLKIYEILWNKKTKSSAEDDAKIYRDFSEVVDVELLNLLAERKEISIQTSQIHEKIDENFDIIFQDRRFIKKVTNKLSVEILQKDLLACTKKEPFVLISDIAGTGKSWAMKTATKMLRQQNSTNWITYVNLQQFIKAFEAQNKKELNFLNFMVEKVFDFERNFEATMFKYLYRKGQVCILFDGFDEISPNYARVVKKLVETFQKNNGNQLWIATRDFFEVDLQKHLKLDTSYKLVDFKDQDGIDLIIRNCVMNDLRSNKVKIHDDFDNQVKNHPKYQTYLQAAINIHQRISNWTLKSIGLPQLYKMIGDVLIEFEDSPEELTEFTLYDKFIDHLYKRWYSEKGKLREQKCIDNQKEDMNYRELHEFCAMKSLFPENSHFCDLELDKDDWSDEEIVGCGILNKKTEDGDEFLFPHETYREFFAASFIIRILKKKPRQIDVEVLKYLIKFCLSPVYGVIQMFLQHGLKDIAALPKNKMTITITNVPKLLQVNIYQFIQKEYKNVENAKNIIVIQDDFTSNNICDDFGDEFMKNSNLNAIVKQSKDLSDQLKQMTEQKSVAIILIVSGRPRGAMLYNNLMKFKMTPKLKELKYGWSDLTDESQNLLLQEDISIDNHTNVTLWELLMGKSGNSSDLSSLKASGELSDIIDDKIMNITANKSQIKVNKSLKYDMEMKPFQLLFQPRNFIKKVNFARALDDLSDQESSDSILLSEDQLLTDVEDKQCILISDVAGTGKTMALQQICNALRQKYPQKWVTYVNLSFSTTDFVYNTTKPEFLTFCIDTLFKVESKLKVKECFLNRYNSGNVIFIFDGFDEVAHENVVTNGQNLSQITFNLIKSFEYNGGNQLWIITKDHFQDKLMIELKVDSVFKMGEFCDADGIKLIAKYAILKNLKVKNDSQMETKFQEIIQTTQDLKAHQELASQLIKKISISENSKLTCVMFSILAKNFDNIKNKKIFEIFTNLVVSHYKLYINFKREAHNDPDSGTEAHQLKFWKIHHFHAIKIMFPELLDSLFPGYDGSEWWDHNLILGGFLSKKNGKFYFLNEAFCAFFVADYLDKNFIIFDSRKLPGKNMKQKIEPIFNPNSSKVELLLKMLTIQEHKITRFFLNDIINFSTLEKIKSSISKFIDSFKEMENFSEFFTNDLEDLADFVIAILKLGNYKSVKLILYKNSAEIMSHAKNPQLFIKFQGFLVKYLKTEDLQELVINKKLFQNIVKSEWNEKLIEDFKTKVQQKLWIARNFVTPTILKFLFQNTFLPNKVNF